MKRLVCLVSLIALVALLCSGALAEGSSFEELVAQRQALDCQLISAEGFDAFTLGQGTFEVGVDLPAGSYRVESSVLTAIAVYEAAPTEEAAPIAEYSVKQKEPLEELTLAEGNVAVITGSQLTLTVLSIEGEKPSATADELKAQRQALTEQLKAAPDYTLLKSAHGTYTIGIDLPAGTYSTSNPPMTVVAIYKGDPHKDENLVTMYTVTAKEPVEKLELEEGLILLIDGMTEIEISSYIGLKF